MYRKSLSQLIVLTFLGVTTLQGCNLLRGIAKLSRRKSAAEKRKARLIASMEKNKAEIETFVQEPAPTTEEAVSDFRKRKRKLYSNCHTASYALSRNKLISEDEQKKKLMWCRQTLDTYAVKAWSNAAKAFIAKKEGTNANWSARLGFDEQQSESWAGPQFDWMALLKQTSAARAEEMQRRFKKRKSYATLNGYACVASERKFGARSRSAKITYHFGNKGDVHVRCYMPQTLRNWLRGKSEATVYGKIWFFTKSHSRGYWRRAPVNIKKFSNKDYFDYSFSIDEWRKGSSDGAMNAQTSIAWVRGYESKYDRSRRSIVRRKLYAYQRINLSMTFGP